MLLWMLERRVAGSLGFIPTPLDDGESETSGPETESEPEEDGASFLGTTPGAKTVFETVAEISMGIVISVLATSLCPRRDCRDESAQIRP